MTTSTVDNDTLAELAGLRAVPSISIYMPSAVRGAEVEQGPIRLKNSLTQAEQALERAGIRSASQLLDEWRPLLVDGEFWLHQGRGLGLLISKDRREILRLPHDVPHRVEVADRFHISPLVAGLDRFRRLVLVVSRGSRRLFDMTRFRCEGVEIDAPMSMDDANWFVDREPQLQSRTGSAAGGFHGHGDDGRTDQADLARYLRAVSAAVAAKTKLPVMLAATDDIRGVYRTVATHEVADSHLPGNHEQSRPDDLHARVLEIAAEGDAQIDRRRATARSRGLETDELGRILAAAAQSRVGELLVDTNAPRQYGTFDPDQMEARITSESGNGYVDLTDLAIELVLRHGGIVTAAGLDRPAVALLRY